MNKQIYLLGFVTLLLSSHANSANFYWFGQTSSDWNNPLNWSSNATSSVPVVNPPLISDVVLIGNNRTTGFTGFDPLLPNGETIISQLIIGNTNNDKGAFTINSGSYLKTSDGASRMTGADGDTSIMLGLNKGSYGELHINGGQITAKDRVTIGDYGNGLLEISNGGKFYIGTNGYSSGNLLIGWNHNNAALTDPTQAQGRVIVTGNGSSIITGQKDSAGLRVGQAGQGWLDILEGGAVVTDNITVGNNTAKSYGEITVKSSTADLSSLESKDYLFIGGSGTGKVLIGENGLVTVVNKVTVGGGTGAEANLGKGNGYLEIDNGTLKIKSSVGYLALGTSSNSATSYGELMLRNDGLLDTNKVVIAEALSSTAKLVFGGLDSENIRQSSGSVTGNINFGLGKGQLIFDHNDNNLVINNIISSGTGLNKGEIIHKFGNLTEITNNNIDFLGQTQIQAGTLSFGNGGSTGYLNGNIIIDEDGALMINHSNDFLLSNYFAGNGTLVQSGTGTTILVLTDSSNDFHGDTLITDGTLKLGNGSDTLQTSLEGTTTVDSSGILLFSHGSIDHHFQSQLLGFGNVVKTDSNTLTFSQDNSGFEGLIKIDEGKIKSTDKLSIGGQNTNYDIGENGILDLIGYEAELGNIDNNGHLILNSLDTTTLNVKRLTQNQSGYLDISLDHEGQPVIQAEEVKLAGTLNVTGFNASDQTPAKSSEIDDKSFLLIKSLTQILSMFDDVEITELPLTTEDFLTSGALILSPDKKELWLNGLRLAWNFGGQEANRGSFTINEGGSFEVDEVLADQTDNGLDWDGKTLTKKGSGLLVLSDNNTYSGGTDIQAGILQVSKDENLGAITSELKLAKATLKIVDNFTSGRKIELESNKSTIETANASQVELTGKLFGTGGLNKAGNGELILKGDLNYEGDTSIQEGSLIFNTDTSNLLGNLNAAGNVIFNYDTDTLFNGSTLGLNNQDGTAIKDNINRLTLLGKKNTLDWLVNAGELEINALDFTGKVQLLADTGLIINQNDITQNAIFGVDLISDDNSYLQKIGKGKVLFEYGDNTKLGNVIVSEGELAFQSSNLNNKNILKVHGDYKTESGASSVISGATSYFDIGGKFTQEDNSKLTVALDFEYCEQINDCEADIRATDVQLGGELYVSGFKDKRPEGGDVIKASQINDVYYRLISSQSEIVGNFTNDPSLENAKFGFLLYTSAFSDDRKTFYIDDLDLSWLEGGKRHGSGDFNLGIGTAFDIDVDLFNQALPNGGFDSGWDGQSLTKLGAGDLILSTKNGYTGKTNVQEGTLTLKSENAIEASESINITQNAQLVSTTGQRLHRLSGDVDSKLLFGHDIGGTLEIIQDNSNDNTEFAGDLIGQGDFLLSGLGSLTLSGDIDYSGDTYIDSGHLILSGKNGKGNLVGDVFGKLGSKFSLIQGSSLTGVIDPTDLFIDDKSLWNMTGDSFLNVVNLAGKINIGNSSEDSFTPLKLTTKDWLGNGGVVNMRTVLGDDSSLSDLIVLENNGSATGKTYLNIINIGGLGAQTQKGILVVDAGADGARTDINAFELYSRVAAGAFEYDLKRQDENSEGESWYLVNKNIDGSDNIRNEIALYAKTDYLIKQIGFNIFPKYYDRIASYEMNDPNQNTWIRTYANYYNAGKADEKNLVNPSTFGNTALLQTGVDIYHSQVDDDIHNAGIFGGLSFNRSRINDFNQTSIGGRLNAYGYTLGLYNSYDSSQFYVDTILQGTYYPDIRMMTDLSGLVKTSAQQFGGSVEAGLRILQTPNFLFEPQAQIYIQKTKIENTEDPYANIYYGNNMDILMRTGLRFSTLKSKISSDLLPKNNAWIELNYFQQIKGNSELDISDLSGNTNYGISESLKDKWIGLNIGYSNQVNEKLNLFFDIDANHSLTSTHYQSIGLHGGLRYSF